MSQSSTDNSILDVSTEQLFSSSLIAAVPKLFQLASSRSASVVHVTADQRPDAFADIAKVMAVSQSGLALLCSSSEQEARDLAVIATAASIKSSTPFLHYYDSKQPVSLEVDRKILEKLVSEQDIENYKSRLAEYSSEKPTTAYLQYKASKASNGQTTDVLGSYESAAAAFSSATGRSYAPLVYTGHPQAEHVVVAMGAAATAAEQRLRELGDEKVGVLNVRVFRPFPAEALFKTVPKSVKRIAVLEPQDFTATWNPVFLEVAAAYQVAGDEYVEIVSAQYGSSVKSTTVDAVLAQLKESQLKRRFVVGEEAESATAHGSTTGDNNVPVETPYIKLLDQVFQGRLEIANAVNSASVWAPDASKPETATPEFGYGKLISKIQERARFVDAVEKALKDNKLSAAAHKALSQWLLLAKSPKHKPDQINDAADEVAKVLESELNTLPAAKSLLVQKDLLRPKSNWLIGSDSWAYDLGQSGVHHVITSGENINMLIVDTTPYSSPVEREQRKKDIGLYAMNYGSVYVASVAIYSSYTGVLHALLEADAYDGPSVVLAYLPHAEARSSLESLKETKICVDNGSWPLYRWNPALEKEGKEPFTLDSQRIKKDLEEFLKRENHLSQLVAQNPDISKALVSSLESVCVASH